MSNNGNHRDNAPGQNKEYSIVINGRPITVSEHKLTYEDILGLANIASGGTNSLFIITFERGPNGNSEGTVSIGGSIVVKDGMVFNVSTTNKS